MSRGPVPSWRVREIIWDLAAKIGPKPEVIIRDFDPIAVSENLGYVRTKIDHRTIRKIIKELQSLSVPLVALLPRHVQELRNDWSDIKDEVREINEEEQKRAIRINDPSKESHLNRIYSLVGLIKSCLANPKMELLPYDIKLPLNLYGCDWRLDPRTWCLLSTPDFSDEKLWGVEFILLKQHMELSPFRKHLEELWESVEKLENDYTDIAIQIFPTD